MVKGLAVAVLGIPALYILMVLLVRPGSIIGAGLI